MMIKHSVDTDRQALHYGFFDLLLLLLLCLEVVGGEVASRSRPTSTVFSAEALGLLPAEDAADLQKRAHKILHGTKAKSQLSNYLKWREYLGFRRQSFVNRKSNNQFFSCQNVLIRSWLSLPFQKTGWYYFSCPCRIIWPDRDWAADRARLGALVACGSGRRRRKRKIGLLDKQQKKRVTQVLVYIKTEETNKTTFTFLYLKEVFLQHWSEVRIALHCFIEHLVNTFIKFYQLPQPDVLLFKSFSLCVLCRADLFDELGALGKQQRDMKLEQGHKNPWANFVYQQQQSLLVITGKQTQETEWIASSLL